MLTVVGCSGNVLTLCSFIFHDSRSKCDEGGGTGRDSIDVEILQ